MEKKTTRRLIGVLVVVALVIILLPLMFTNNDTQAPTQTALVTPQPLPDTIPDATKPADANTLAENNIANSETPADVETPVMEVGKNAAPAVKPEMDKATVAKVKTESKAVKVAANKKAPDAEPSDKPDQNGDFVVAANGDAQPLSIVPAKKDRNTAQTLAAERQAGWVVQMGSFRNLANVKHLMNQLNAKGYHAFTYETKSNGQTRVYVGPKFQREAALELLNNIQRDVKMRGVILSYKPKAA